MPTRRRQSRILALQTLYEADTTGHDAEETLERLLEGGDTTEEVKVFARELVAGAVAERQHLDEVIARVAPAWPIEQMATIDRNILRLAILEILLNNRTPVKAAINEAVELAKSFGSDNSAKFVNGVLGSVSSMAAR
ncbi:MAG TPA: transcription antitermination factor NusB [Dehalococcoidia bacterium]|nr:transcription antitermination factor NusB [Dehalococcoidia bacterium]